MFLLPDKEGSMKDSQKVDCVTLNEVKGLNNYLEIRDSSLRSE